VSTVTIVEDARSASLIEALESNGFQNVQRIPHIKGFFPEPTEHLQALVRVLELALHRRKETLQRALIDAAREMSRHVDALLLGYGLCGSALENPQALLDVDVPIFVPMDGDHAVDDCVGLALGGRECYYAEQRRVPGTFFMTPGWSCHWQKLFGPHVGDRERKAAKRLFAHYERALLVMTPVMPQDDMKQRAHEFSQLFDLRVEEQAGTLDILSQAWQTAKAFLESKAD
jgi:hypothetical protein